MNIKKSSCALILILGLLTIIVMTGCTQTQGDPLVRVTEDETRVWYYDRQSVTTRTDQEGTYVDAWVRFELKDKSGLAVADRSRWHLDPKARRYKVSDTYAYDRDGHILEN